MSCMIGSMHIKDIGEDQKEGRIDESCFMDEWMQELRTQWSSMKSLKCRNDDYHLCSWI